jgi:hypothetical protein
MRNIYYYLIDNQTFPFRVKGKTVDYQYIRVFQSGLNYKILFLLKKYFCKDTKFRDILAPNIRKCVTNKLGKMEVI